MLKYPGNKSRHADEILATIQRHLNRQIECWVEPFVGGGGMLARVPAATQRIAGDHRPEIVRFLKAIQSGWMPTENVTEEDYRAWRNFGPPMALRTFIGHQCSFGGKWWGGYARSKNSRGEWRNYAAEGVRRLCGCAELLRGVEFYCCDYRRIPTRSGAVVYFDPPYRGTTGYGESFDHAEFWAWATNLSRAGFKVFVSEYSAPPNWRLIWEKPVNGNLHLNTGSKKSLERLFVKK